MAEIITNISYQIISPNEIANDDSNLIIDVSIIRRNGALAGATEDGIVEFVRTYLSTLTEDPLNITKTQTTETTGL